MFIDCLTYNNEILYRCIFLFNVGLIWIKERALSTSSLIIKFKFSQQFAIPIIAGDSVLHKEKTL